MSDPGEYVTNLAEVIANLGLLPLSPGEEEAIRGDLGGIIGRYQFEIGEFREEGSRLRVADVQATMKAIADHLEEDGRILRAAETGFHQDPDIEVVNKLTELLGMNPEIGDRYKARDFIVDFCNRSRTVAHACRVAVKDLGSMRARGGRPPLEPHYRDFTALLVKIAGKNEIRATVENDRDTGMPRGRFVELAERFEQLLPPRMRSDTRHTVARRLQQSLKSLGRTRARQNRLAAR